MITVYTFQEPFLIKLLQFPESAIHSYNMLVIAVYLTFKLLQLPVSWHDSTNDCMRIQFVAPTKILYT